MKKYLMGLLIAMLFVGTVALASSSIISEICQQMESRGTAYIWLPKVVSDFFKGERINLDFDIIGEGTLRMHGIVTNQKIADLRCGSAEIYDYWVAMNVLDALELGTSEKPIITFVTLWKKGNIRLIPIDTEKESKLQQAEVLLTPQDNEPVPSWMQEMNERSREEYIKYQNKNGS